MVENIISLCIVLMQRVLWTGSIRKNSKWFIILLLSKKKWKNYCVLGPRVKRSQCFLLLITIVLTTLVFMLVGNKFTIFTFSNNKLKNYQSNLCPFRKQFFVFYFLQDARSHTCVRYHMSPYDNSSQKVYVS